MLLRTSVNPPMMYKRTPVLFLSGDSHRSHRLAAFVSLSHSLLCSNMRLPPSIIAQIVYRLLEEIGRLYLVDADANCRIWCFSIRTFAAHCLSGLLCTGVYMYIPSWNMEAIFVHREYRATWANTHAIFVIHFDPFHKLRGKSLRFFIRLSFCLFVGFLIQCSQFIRERQTRHRQQLPQISRPMATYYTKEYQRRFYDKLAFICYFCSLLEWFRRDFINHKNAFNILSKYVIYYMNIY